MKKIDILVATILGFVALSACRTQFVGEAHYPGGPQACVQTCASQNMEMSAFVYSGEFASSCVCKVRFAPAPAAAGAPGGQAEADEAEAVDAATLAGVSMQMDDDDNDAHSANRSLLW